MEAEDIQIPDHPETPQFIANDFENIRQAMVKLRVERLAAEHTATLHGNLRNFGKPPQQPSGIKPVVEAWVGNPPWFGST